MRCIDEKDVQQIQKVKKGGLPWAAIFIAKIIGNMVFWLMLVLVALLVSSLVFAKATGGPPTIVGHRMYIVLSGSMSPAFDAGSLALVKPTAPSDIKSGDIITYKGLGSKEQFVSHRVMAVNELNGSITFTTKGDANDVTDPNPVQAENLVGRVTLAIPYLGYFMEYTKTKQGLLVLVIAPTLILLVYESASLLKHMKAKSKAKIAQCEPEEESKS